MNDLPKRLPEPYGNAYWCGDPYVRKLPAIFLIASPRSLDVGKWFICPAEADVPFRDGKILAFETAQEALQALHAMYRRGLR